jgi:hypothetical protein
MGLEGRIDGGRHGRAWASPLVDLATVGYVEEEWLLAGDAVTYDFRPDGGPSVDGFWDTAATGTMPYRTRVVVRRPRNPAQFNGTVVVSWNNVSAGFEILQWEGPETWAGGYVTIGVSAQRVGLHGYKADPRGLVAWDPERYRTLEIPSDAASYGIFATVIGLVAPGQVEGGLLSGFDVQRVIATGASQSAARLHTYVNGVHPHVGIVDAFILDVYGGTGAPIARRPADPALALYPAGRLRDDIGVSIMVTNSETESVIYASQRRPDDDRFVYWEIAGVAHGGASGLVTAAKNTRDWGFPLEPPVDRPGDLVPNELDKQPVEDASLHRVHRWLVDGTRPPSVRPIELTGEPPEIVRDEHGIARGGLRLPQVEVPTAVRSGLNDGPRLVQLIGSKRDFTPEELRALYSDHATYVERFRAAATAAATAGYLLERDVEAMVREAEASPVP